MAKVKSKINKMLSWLCSKPHNEQEIWYRTGSKDEVVSSHHELNVAKEQDKRLLERNQKKDSSYRRKLRKYRVLQQAMQNCV